MMMVTAVPTKGASGKFASDRAGHFMEKLGDRSSKVTVKTDQVPAIKYLIKDIIDTRPEGQTMPEESTDKPSGSNGVVERSVQDLEGQLRAMMSACEGRVGRKVDAKEGVILFMPECAAYAVHRREVRADGKLHIRRAKAKRLPGSRVSRKVLDNV